MRERGEKKEQISRIKDKRIKKEKKISQAMFLIGISLQKRREELFGQHRLTERGGEGRGGGDELQEFERVHYINFQNFIQ